MMVGYINLDIKLKPPLNSSHEGDNKIHQNSSTHLRHWQPEEET